MRLSGSGKWFVKSISTCDTFDGGLRRATGDMAVSSEHKFVTGAVPTTCMDNQESTCGTSCTCWLARSLAGASGQRNSTSGLG
jgi:hypothetical protein